MLRERLDRLQIRTPEGILFSFLLASPIARFLAFAVDLAFIIAALTVLRFVFAFIGIFSADVAFAVQTIAYFVISIGYGVTTEWYWRGQTLGKRLLNLRVLDAHGLKLSASQIVVRNLFRAIDMLPAFYVVGGVACLCTRKSQRLGDLVAQTIVVRHPPVREPDLDQLAPGKWNSLREQPHLAARLRQRVSPRLAGGIVDAILRRQDFAAEKRLHLFHDLANYFKQLVPYPAEIIEGIGDEQYVRNVADIIFRSNETSNARARAQTLTRAS
jgi:uncharacterized RDD family membrane protein YckC